jgi:hypothetical protein
MRKSIFNRLFYVVVGLLSLCVMPATGYAARIAEPADPVDTPAIQDLQSPQSVLPSGQGPLSGGDELVVAFEDGVTGAFVNQIRRGAAECSRLEPVYRIDCLQRVFKQASGAGQNRPDYSSASSELRRLSRTLNGIVGKNTDRKAGKAQVGGKSYRAVTREALRQANRDAAKAIEEAATKLLRSAGNSSKRKTHYTRIADAVNSTKKILRS